MIVKIVPGDLLEAQELFIAQQCNCCTTRAHGLSDQIFSKFPYADVYAQRPSRSMANRAITPSKPGTVSVHVKKGYPTILNLMGQYGPGKPHYSKRFYSSDKYKDDATARLGYFSCCLRELESIVGDQEVAIPFSIGCGLAGGDWTKYETLLREAKTRFVMYQKE